MTNAVISARARVPAHLARAAQPVRAAGQAAAPADHRPADGGAPPDFRPRCRVAPSALALLESARRGLAEAAGETAPAGRYVAAHLAALRAAAAVVTVRGDPAAGARRKRPRSVWELLPQAEPPLAEWAAFFAAGARKRAAAEAGLSHAASAQEADDLLRDAGIFLSVVEDALGVPGQPLLPFQPQG